MESQAVGSQAVGSQGGGFAGGGVRRRWGSQAVGSQAVGSQAVGSQAVGSQAVDLEAELLVSRELAPPFAYWLRSCRLLIDASTSELKSLSEKPNAKATASGSNG
ncbi:MAG: hypothetical protein WDO18_00480 [Acidobacteriota bacterium]